MKFVSDAEYKALLDKYYKLDSAYSTLSMQQNDMKHKLDALEKRLIHYIEKSQQQRQKLSLFKRSLGVK